MKIRSALSGFLALSLLSCGSSYEKMCIVEREPEGLVCTRSLNKAETEKMILLLELEGEDYYLTENEEIFYKPSYSEEFNTVIWSFTDKVQDSIAYKERISYLMDINKVGKLPDIESIKSKRRK